MKSFNRFLTAVLAVTVIIFIACNICLKNISADGGRKYRIEANRIARTISESGAGGVDLSEYETITAVVPLSSESTGDFFTAESDYLIIETDGEFYRIEYTSQDDKVNESVIKTVNIFLSAIALLTVGTLIFIRQRILKPFVQLREVPSELAKGNLTVPIKERKGRFFGKFVWGLDMLRERLENSRARELELHKEKKTLLLSLSHDIKTPLSAIKLYANALSKGIYKDNKKQIEAAESINAKADEIESFVSEIIRASSEDFLYLEVNMGKFYLSQAVTEISDYYGEKLAMLGVDFIVGRYGDCLLRGDIDRAVEVLQNIIENAVKYGDGRSISIEFDEEEECKLVTIRNSGCTLEETELAHVFDSFWRGSNVGSNQGSGLGLYICRQLMHKMDGEALAEIKNGEMLVSAIFIKA
mgnify:FL=1